MIVQPPPGTRDFLPEDMYRREYVINEIKEVFEKYGFEPLETPVSYTHLTLPTILLV